MKVDGHHFFITISLNVVFSFHFLFIFALEYRLLQPARQYPAKLAGFFILLNPN
jgi:hypothetical protein